MKLGLAFANTGPFAEAEGVVQMAVAAEQEHSAQVMANRAKLVLAEADKDVLGADLGPVGDHRHP